MVLPQFFVPSNLKHFNFHLKIAEGGFEPSITGGRAIAGDLPFPFLACAHSFEIANVLPLDDSAEKLHIIVWVNWEHHHRELLDSAWWMI